jgi:very-short-patch-repair endonuclease
LHRLHAGTHTTTEMVPEDLWKRRDEQLEHKLYGMRTGLGSIVTDARRIVLVPTHCMHPDTHRYMRAIDSVVRVYRRAESDLMHGLDGIACRMCAPHHMFRHRRAPSILERRGYEAIAAQHGGACYCFFEWHAYHKYSVDVVLVSKRDTALRCAIHIDGNQHATTRERDCDLDAQLAKQFTHVVRLRAKQENTWADTLKAHTL